MPSSKEVKREKNERNQETDYQSYRNYRNFSRGADQRVYRRAGEFRRRLVPHRRTVETLSQPVNEQESFPAAYRSEDLADLKSQTDSQLGDVVLYEEGKGYEGYTVDFTALALSGATAKPVFLSEQQTGALAEIVFHQQTGGVLTIADKEISVCVLQIAFTEIDAETGNADLNVTVKLDLTPFKTIWKVFLSICLKVSSRMRCM